MGQDQVATGDGGGSDAAPVLVSEAEKLLIWTRGYLLALEDFAKDLAGLHPTPGSTQFERGYQEALTDMDKIVELTRESAQRTLAYYKEKLNDLRAVQGNAAGA